MMDTKEVYIVYDNKSKKYANYLAQLISTCSTRSEKKIVASCWSPDIYEHLLVEMTTENRVLFVGDGKELCAYTSEKRTPLINTVCTMVGLVRRASFALTAMR